MKAKTPLVLIFAICCLWQTSTNAQCDVTSDVIQNTSNTNVSFGAGGDTYGNTFTPTCSGKIEGISFWTREASGSIGGISMTVELYRNPLGNNPVLLASQTGDIPFDNGNRERYFVFDDEPDVVSGTSYGFRVTRNDTQFSVKILLNNSNPYSGGRMFLNDFDDGNITQNWDLRFRIHYLDEAAPNANCRNITRTLGTNGTVNISASNINNNSTDADSGIASLSISQSTFDCSDIGDNIVTLFVRDQNGNGSSCQATVTILDATPPELTCPGDMVVPIDPGEALPTVNYDDVGYSDCTVETPSGFDFLGVWNGKSYFLSQTTLLPSQAYTNAETIGGYLATIEDAQHNEFIRSATANLGEVGFLIGFSDVAIEDSFVWHDPNATSTYTNWATIEPNDAGAGEDYTQMNGGGKWNDINNNTPRKYVIELSQSTISQTAGLTSGSTFPLGTTTNTFEATDGSGNTGTCSFNVTVEVNPYETNVALANGKLTITDIENDSDDQITLSNDGTTLTISNLVLPTVSGGPTLLNQTTVTVPMANITNGIEFIGGNGTDTIDFDGDLILTGTNNDITISGLAGNNGFANSGHINIGGDFTISNSNSAVVLLGELTAVNLSITNVDRIRDLISPSPINISGQTDLQAITSLQIIETATHTFTGTVNLQSRTISFHAIGPTNLGTVTTTGTGDFLRSNIRIGPGSLNLTGNIVTAGDSDLYLRAQTTINQSGGTITTDNLILDGRNTGETTALFLRDNDINMIEVETGGSMGLIVFNDIDDLEIGWFTIDAATLIASTINLADNTDIFKNGTGVLSILSSGDLNITNSDNNSLAYIDHNGGSIEFDGTNITVEKLDYQGNPGTFTRFLGTTTFNDVDINTLEFGTLKVQSPVNIGSSNLSISILDELLIDNFEGVLSGAGAFTGGSTTVEFDGTISQGDGTTPSTLTTASIEFDDGTYSPYVISSTDHDQLDVNGTVTLTDANLTPLGGFQAQSDDAEIILINNDGTDAVIGTFNGLAEGTAISFGDYGGIISYVGGDGNDVTLLPDTVNPVAVCQDISIAIGLDGVTVTANELDGGSTDNAGVETFLINGATELSFTYEDLGDNEVTLTVVDFGGNTATCTATITLTSNIDYPILISEYQPVADENSPIQQIEISGKAGEPFVGTLVLVEGDVQTGEVGVVKEAYQLSSTFGANDLLVVLLNNIPDPTHTVVLTTSFSGTINFTDVDTDNDGELDDISDFGVILDAVGITNAAVCCPVDIIYGEEFGGVDLGYIGSQPYAVFRESSRGDFFQLHEDGTIYDSSATVVDASLFDTTPTINGTFGQINPSISLSTSPDAYVTTWKTDNSGNSNDNQITIFTDNDETYNYNIDWGDGTSNLNVTGNITHTYSTIGTYTVGITGTFPRFISNGSFFGDAEKLISIDQWGTNAWSSFEEAFVECENMDLVATDIPDLSNVTSLSRMFDNCQSLIANTTINNWNVSNVENMQLMFVSAFNFNQPLNNWNVGNVTNMTSMFNSAESFNQDLNNWNTSQVQFMDFMFISALDFNGAIGNWNVSQVTDMSWMFNNAEDFNQDLNSWNVSEVEEMDFMFLGATNFNGNIANWNTSKVTTMYAMFQNASAFNQNISGWNVSQVTDMGWMFRNATNFNQPIGNWNVSNVTLANEMLIGTAFSDLNYDQLLINWSQLTLQNDASFGTDASYCFGESARNTLTDPSGFNWNITDGGLNCDSFFITKWKTDNLGNSGDNQVKITTVLSETYDYTIFWGDGTSNSGVTGDITHTYSAPGTYTVSITGTFPRITTDTPNTPGDTSDKLKLIEVVQWGSNPWISMELAFSGCSNLDVTATDIPNLSNAMSMSNMFADCTNLVGTSAFNNWDVSTITDMRALFFDATLFNQDISNWNVSAVETMEFMFMFGDNFNQDISGWNVSSVTSMEDMFNSATNFDQDIGNWDISSLQTAEDMFANTALSTNNYDKLLIGWNTLDAGETQIPNGITFNAGNSKYCIGENARNTLTDASGLDWIITDGGSNCDDAFITTWKTDNQGGTNDNSIRIPALGGIFNYSVDWGDGTIETGITGLTEHTYSAAGTYDVTITGDFPRILFDNALFINTGSLQPGADRLKIIEVKQWGTISWSTMERAFYGCENLDVTATDTPDLSNVTRLTQMFNSCYSLIGTVGFDSWDVSTIDDMRSTFAGAKLFNQSINSWNVSNVTQMFSMFAAAEVFNQPLNNWNVSNVEQMAFMFNGAKDFNQNIDNWNVSDVTEMTSLFHGAEDFNQPLNSWNVSNVTRMGSMFKGASSFNQPLGNWNVSNVESTTEMFSGASSFNQNINSWNVSDVEFMLRMFQNAIAYNQPLNNWNVSKVRSMWGMFQGASVFNQPINSWDVGEVEQMKDMFANATAFDQELSNWDLSSMVSGNLGMAGMFNNSGLSLDNYDNTIIGWATLDAGETQIPTNVDFNGGISQYCASETQRQELIDTYGWEITDAGLNCPTTIYVMPYVYLQGASLNPNVGEETLMRDDLRAAGLLPTTSPYTDGVTVDPTVFDTAGNDAIVDWVWVELRDKNNNTTIVAEKSALLQRDGDVLGTDLTALSFSLPVDQYYVAIKHRNHLGIMSASPISLFGSPLVVDFTDGSVPTYGTNAQTIFGMPVGMQGMWTGDANGDGKVNFTGADNDTNTIRDVVLNNPLNIIIQFYGFTVSGYNNSDINMTGGTNISGANNDANVLRDNILNHPINQFIQFYGYSILEQLPEVLSLARLSFDKEMIQIYTQR